MSASSARAFQYPTGSRRRATRSPSGSSAGTAFATSAHTSVAPMTSESIEAARRVARVRPTAASTMPSPRNAAYATVLLKASQLRSATMDHQTVAPVHTTRSTSAQSSAAPERPVRGTGSHPNADAASAPASTRTAAPPTGSVPPTSEPSPANMAPARTAPTSTAKARAPAADARLEGSDAGSMTGHASSAFGSSSRTAGYGRVRV